MDEIVLLGHGSGGSMMKRIIDEVFFEAYGNNELLKGDDAACLTLTDSHIAFSTDSFVVSPHFFPGGDIGRLAVCGTVNDVATSGARPLYLSCGFILEEGYPLDNVRRICKSMAEAAREAHVSIVTGDTKVVNKGLADGIFINTSGVGVLPSSLSLSGANCKPGDKVLISGTIGDHGITIMSCRESLSFTAPLSSDAAPLSHLIENVLRKTGCFETAEQKQAILEQKTFPVRCFRDPTRGGVASTLNEIASQSLVDITINEESLPIKNAVQGACDMLGYDVLQVANEGKMICIVAPEVADIALQAMKASPYGEDAALIGEVSEPQHPDEPKVYVRNGFGGRRILDMLVGEQLPRIC